MKKLVKKGLFIFFIIMNLLLPIAYAEDKVNPDMYAPSSQSGGKVFDIGNVLIGGVQLIGSIISVITLIVIGIKYIVGSVEERAEYKKSLMPYVIGAVMVFSISNLLGIISDIIG